ncbi:capsule biosynthesis protein [Thioclava nitratireducens]|uniref:Capsule biosynthesis protein n=1 Tax=Thioclava nitratireducens TaxID=1915078 RepID=A0ABM6II34_9RHOB|nr:MULTISPECIES: capsule biosynthesis protein [Thioclava]AQS48408.1 capsule biosynthesis protein [Thioclava nitratireducens]OWY08075.1 capsule biosynthesis protein [Thioclava sp. F42-5]
MTTSPKAPKFRIRRDGPVITGSDGSLQLGAMPLKSGPGTTGEPTTPRASNASAASAAQAAPSSDTPEPQRQRQRRHRDSDPSSMFEPQDDGFGDQKFPTAERNGAEVIDAGQRTPEEEIDAIRAEGLTGRQLRLARRMAQKHGVQASSDFEAVLLLRRRGIDPFDRSNIVAMVKPGEAEATSRALARTDGPGADTRVNLPQTIKKGQLPSTEVMTEDRRAAEILRIQRDIAKRRRRKLMLLGARLGFFVVLPTLMAAYYYFAMATPMYATKSAFVIQKAEGLGNSGLGSLFSGTQLATNQDSVTVQSYLQSRDAMKRLDRDQGFKKIFEDPSIDPLQRLPKDATDEQAYRLYSKMVEIGYDPSEGIVKMEVIAPDPQKSQQFSESLISYAEQQVDQLTSRLRDDQMKGARESYQDAEAKVFAAQSKVQQLQEKVGVLDPVSENSVVMGQVANLENQLQQKRLELGQLLDNARPNQARVSGVQGDIRRIQALLEKTRGQLTAGRQATGGESLAAVTGQLQIAQGELQTRQMLLSAAAQQMETARIEANKQVRYLEMGVRPVAPDEPTYPRAFENTLLAFLIFSGIYLMLSLTASVLREQVSS